MAEYMVRQFDGPPVRCDGKNCAAASGATGVAFGSGGEKRPTADEFRELSGVSCINGRDTPSGGLNVIHVARTGHKYGVDIDYGPGSTGVARRTPALIKSKLLDDYGCVVAGDYDQIPNAYSFQPSFNGDHSTWMHDYRTDLPPEHGTKKIPTVCWHDPLGHKPIRMPWSIAMAYNQKPGSQTKGIIGFVKIKHRETNVAIIKAAATTQHPSTATALKDTKLWSEYNDATGALGGTSYAVPKGHEKRFSHFLEHGRIAIVHDRNSDVEGKSILFATEADFQIKALA